MVNREASGVQGEPFTVVVERGKVHEFARAVRSKHPAYFAEAPVAPPTFLTTMFFWEALVPGSNPWSQVGMDPKRGMHAEQEYVFHGPPPRAGDRLTARSRIDRIYEKVGRRGGTLTFVEMVTEFRDPEGLLVAEAKMTCVEPQENPR